MRRRSLLALTAVLAACADGKSVVGPPDPGFDIVDGRAEGGNPHFFWLPPIGPGGPSAGTPATEVAPEVHICVLADGACGDEVAHFTMAEGSGSELIRRDDSGAHFIVNWHTRDAGLDPLATYRILVRVGAAELGHADVRAVHGKQKKDVDASAFVVIQPDQTLPIRFRIEDGAIAEQPLQRQGLATGPYHTCVLTTEGAAHCWGSGWSGQLGNGVYGETAAPSPVAGDHRFVALALGTSHTCGLDEAGAAWCWGSNASGALGTGAVGGSQNAPVAVSGGLVFTRIEAGTAFTCGRTPDSALHCWGRGSSGQLGTGATLDSPAPAAVAGGTAFAAFDVGDEHACAVTPAGEAWCWGANGWGQIGNGSVATLYPYIGGTAPQAVTGGTSFTSITAGASHTCALTAAGEAWCWGAGWDGQLGNGTTTPVATGPIAVLGGHALRSISAGAGHTCAVAADGSARCWGSNGFGQTGTGTPGAPARILEPAPVLGDLAWSVVAGAATHSCGVTAAGEGMCWGLSTLGNGTWDPSSSPVAIAGALVLPAH